MHSINPFVFNNMAFNAKNGSVHDPVVVNMPLIGKSNRSTKTLTGG